MVLDGKFWQEFPINAAVPQGSNFHHTHLLISYFSNLPNILSNIAFYADDATFYAMFDRSSDLWQQLELVCDLKSDLRGNLHWNSKHLHSMVGITLVLLISK